LLEEKINTMQKYTPCREYDSRNKDGGDSFADVVSKTPDKIRVNRFPAILGPNPTPRSLDEH